MKQSLALSAHFILTLFTFNLPRLPTRAASTHEAAAHKNNYTTHQTIRVTTL